MGVKKHLTIDEQIELLKTRGCIIEDEELAKNILLDINYYRLTSYFLSFKESDDKYSKGTSFNKVYRNYLFDRKLRNMLSYVIEHIEIAIKTRIAYYHSLKYGPLGYLDSNNYNNKFDENILQTNLNKYIKRNEKNPIVIHHITKYEGKFPLWVIIEFFDFSDASKMYSQLDTKLQKEIARTFNSNSTCLSSWLYCLTHLRNCCAHYARIYNTIMISMPVTPKNYKSKFNKTIFSYLLVVKEILKNTNDWVNFVIELAALIEEYKDDIELYRLGFPSNWYDLMIK